MVTRGKVAKIQMHVSHMSQTFNEHVKLGLKMSNSSCDIFECVCNEVAVSVIRVLRLCRW